VAALRVAGTDPGTSSLDALVLEDGAVFDQCRFTPDELRADHAAPVRWLEERGPYALVAGPSGYGLPLVSSHQITAGQLQLMTLVRPEERGRAQGVAGFSSLVRALCASLLPVVFLPGVIHLPTVPVRRKLNRIDLGTPDKLSVAALGLARWPGGSFCVVELGTAFTACVVIQAGQIVAGRGGTCGAVGWGSAGAWDGEAAYLLSPLTKADLFSGGAGGVGPETGGDWLCESLLETVAGLQALVPFEEIVLSGRQPEFDGELAARVSATLGQLGRTTRLQGLPGVWVKQAAQGAALLADGLAGGRYASLVEVLQLRGASGTVLDWLQQPRAGAIRALFAG
jgi:predicted butyrate kinase (DUF1464 family)